MNKIIYDKFRNNPIIAAVRDEKGINNVLNSPVEIVFIVRSDIINCKNYIKKLKEHGLTVFIHIDLIEGLDNVPKALEYICYGEKPDGIITTKSNLIVEGKKLGLCTIQRVFLVDSTSEKTAVFMAKKNQPDAIEIMPGIISSVIKKIKKEINTPIITGGIIDTKEQIIKALEAGAISVSVSKKEIWQM